MGTVNYFFDRPLVRRSSSSVQDRLRMLVRESDFMSNRPSLSFRISLRREARVGSSCDEVVFLFGRFIQIGRYCLSRAAFVMSRNRELNHPSVFFQAVIACHLVVCSNLRRSVEPVKGAVVLFLVFQQKTTKASKGALENHSTQKVGLVLHQRMKRMKGVFTLAALKEVEKVTDIRTLLERDI